MLEFTGDSDFPFGLFADNLVSNTNHILGEVLKKEQLTEHERIFYKKIIFLIKTKKKKNRIWK